MMTLAAKKKYRAFGLVEALIGIAIFGVAIVVATAVSIDSLKQVKENEVADFANSVMVQTLEFSKSNKVALTTLQGNGNTFQAFKIDGSLENITGISLQNDTTKLASNACSTTSPYYINIDWPEYTESTLCNQIIVEATSSGNFKITSRVVYSLEDEVRVSEILGYRTVR